MKDYEPTFGPHLVVSPHIASRYEQAIETAFRILNSEGNAFDAQDGVTVVENVLASCTGMTSGTTKFIS